MYINIGIKNFKKKKGTTAQLYSCPSCNQASHWNAVRKIGWFSFLFVPLFPCSVKTTLVCPICGLEKKLHAQEKQEALADLQTDDMFQY